MKKASFNILLVFVAVVMMLAVLSGCRNGSKPSDNSLPVSNETADAESTILVDNNDAEVDETQEIMSISETTYKSDEFAESNDSNDHTESIDTNESAEVLDDNETEDTFESPDYVEEYILDVPEDQSIIIH